MRGGVIRMRVHQLNGGKANDQPNAQDGKDLSPLPQGVRFGPDLIHGIGTISQKQGLPPDPVT
jgi:hypothetical protein